MPATFSALDGFAVLAVSVSAVFGLTAGRRGVDA